MYKFSFILFVALIGCSEPEKPLKLDHGSYVNDFHKANVGQIYFTNGWSDLKEFDTAKSIDEVALASTTDLGLRIFMKHTQTHYLDSLSSGMTPEELCEKGSWNARFYVDEELAYEENLSNGAGSCWYRNANSAFYVPLLSADEELIDHWGTFLWTKFLKKGKGDAMLREGRHHLRIELRPYIRTDEIFYGPITARGSVFVSNELRPVSREEKAYQNISPTDEWPINYDEVDQGTIEQLNERIVRNEYEKVNSIVVIKDGSLVLEEYFNGTNRSSLHQTRSVGKTFVSAMMGIAIDDGLIKDEKVTLGEIYNLRSYENYSSIKGSLSIHDLLTMRSGLAASDRDMNSPGNEEKMYDSSNWEKFVLNLDVDQTNGPGKDFNYVSVASVLAGKMLERKLPNGLEEYTKSKLFSPLNIKTYNWQKTPSGSVNTAGGLHLRTLDYAKFGQLYKQFGKWNNKQIISKEWVDKSMTVHASIEQDDIHGYGYYFWKKGIEVDGHEYKVTCALGNGGNTIMIFDDIPVVVVVTATLYGTAYAHAQTTEIVRDFVLPAIGY